MNPNTLSTNAGATTTPPSPTRRRGRPAVLGAGGAAAGIVANALLVVGALLLVASALIHLHLWDDGYRHIPTIGPLFLAQVVAGLILAVVLAATRRVWAAVLAFGFVASTIAGFLLSVNVGLFGFQDSWSSAYAGMAFTVEVADLVVLVAGGLLCVLRWAPGRRAVSPTGPPPD